MEQNETYQKDIASIRKMMERSVKFISLSGLSGILAGTYALAGAATAYYLLLYPGSADLYESRSFGENGLIGKLLAIAAIVLLASLASGFWLTARKAKKMGATIWNATSRNLLINLAIPLVTGGIFIIVLLLQGYVEIVAPACLIFYGLALINASPNLVEEVRNLGYSEIILGLICAAFPAYSLVFWAIGFGLLHIVYGAVMYKKYDA